MSITRQQHTWLMRANALLVVVLALLGLFDYIHARWMVVGMVVFLALRWAESTGKVI